MQATKFRIGNTVMARGEVAKIVGIRTDTDEPCFLCDNSDVWIPNIGSIPLTAEILEASGFRMNQDRTYGVFNVVFYPYGDGSEELDIHIVVDLEKPHLSEFEHQYTIEGRRRLYSKSYEGNITTVDELENVAEMCGCEFNVIISNENPQSL